MVLMYKCKLVEKQGLWTRVRMVHLLGSLATIIYSQLGPAEVYAGFLGLLNMIILCSIYTCHNHVKIRKCGRW